MDQREMKTVFTVVENPKTKKNFWMKVGVGFTNRDGSITLKLDALPVNGTLQVREYESREEWIARKQAEGAPPSFGTLGNNGTAIAGNDAVPF